MTTIDVAGPTISPTEDVPLVLDNKPTGADRVFNVVLFACSLVVLLVMGSIAFFLLNKGWGILASAKFHFITDPTWAPDAKHYGVSSLLLGSVAIALVAIVIAVPVSLATALMINEYAPRKLRSLLTSVVDLLATVPSIVYGFWGLELVSGLQASPAKWIATNFSFIPFFRTISPDRYVKSIFACGLISAITIIPIVTSISREVMAQAPRDVCEASLGLGGTRWGMVTNVILPFSKNGILGAILLGIGRGLGETMIVVLVLSSNNKLTTALLGPGGLGSIAAEITKFFESVPTAHKNALILAGLALFITTLAINALARMVVQRGTAKAL